MDIFNRSEDEILFDLIARDNPNLSPKLTPANCYISTAVPNTGVDAQQYNSVAYVVPRHNSGLHGRRAVKYNRIALEDLFRGITKVAVQGFSVNEAYATREEIAVFIGETYGLPIREGDVDTVASSLQFYPAPHAEYGRGVYKIANNKCFIGQIYVAFARDFTKSLSNVFKPNYLNALNMLANVTNVKDHPEWPQPYAFFADYDFTEIAAAVNHNNHITLAQATTIGQHVNRTFFEPAGAYNPAVHYDSTNPYAFFGVWKTHQAMDKTSVLVKTYPWIKTQYTHAKITRMDIDPATGLAPDQPYYFAFYYNWFVAP